jgi:hypothetical protein
MSMTMKSDPPTIEERKFARKYLDQIIFYLCSDIKSYLESEEKNVSVGCGPFLLTAASGVDFLGSTCVPATELSGKVKSGLEDKSKAGFIYYLDTFMREVNDSYSATGMGEYLYKVVRCGQVHEAMVKHGVMMGKKGGRDYHLKMLAISRGTSSSSPPVRCFYFNAKEFARDFVNSIRFFNERFDRDDDMTITVISRLQEYETDLGSLPNWPEVREVTIDDRTCADLYERSSSSPFNPSGVTTLIGKYWQWFDEPK